MPKDAVFWHTLRPTERVPILDEDLRVDAVVVGGGVAGLSAAETLREGGLSVILLEREFCGAGASGKSSGFITPDSELELGQLVRRFGPEKAKKLWEFAISGVEHIRQNIKRFQVDCDYQEQDSLFTANTVKGFADIVEEYEARARLGYASAVYKKEEIGAVLGSAHYDGAVRYPDTFGIVSYLYCRAMCRALIEMGVRVYEGTPVTYITGSDVGTPRARVSAGAVVIAGDRFTPELGKLRKTIYHAQTFLMVSSPLSDADVRLIFPEKPLMVWDTDLIYQYYRLIGGNRLLLGGGSVLYTYLKNEKHNTRGIARKLMDYFSRKFPQIEVQWEYIWPGLIGITKDLLPIAGQDGAMPNIYYAGASAGLPWSAAGGRYVAEKIIDKRSDYDEFFSPRRRFIVPDPVQSLIGAKAAFGLANLWSKYYQKG